MKYDSKKSMVILYIISMTIAFTTQYADYEIGYGLQIIIGLLWIFLGIWKLDINGFKFRGVYKDDFPRFLKLYLLPHIVIHGYTIILMCFGIVDKKYFTTNLTVYVPTVLAIFAIYLLGINALYYTVVSLLLSWLLSVSVSLAIKGPMIIIHAIRQGLIDPFDTTGGLSMNYFELHDLVLAIGYVMVYYIFSKEKYETIITKFYDRNEKNTKLTHSVLTNVGMVREGILRNRLINDEGKKINKHVYSILKEEWQATRKQ